MKDEEEKKVEFQDGVAVVFEFISTLKKCNTDSDEEGGMIERDYTRLDFLDSSINNDDMVVDDNGDVFVVIRAQFYISKESRVLLSCDD
jgi:hypothetical protein